MQTPFRPEPAMPVHAYTTYALVRPDVSHFRAATCADVDCPNRAHGWTTRIDTTTPLGQQQARYITHHAGRRYTARLENGVLIFEFPAGQECFAEHRLPVQREPLYVVRGGDHRGNPRGEKRLHTRGADWVDDMSNHLDQLNTERQRG